MNVLSLFDGMSCGQIALNRLGITYDNYFASEIDKYAIKVTMANYPDTIQIGCVTKVRAKDLPKIDLMMGGSPCQGFSKAGKQLNFDDPRSKLFFEYVRLLKECKPKYFLLENVKMKKEYQDVISEYLGVPPVEINSSLVSAQNRRRLYWTNIPNVTQPEDKRAFLKDIIDCDLELSIELNENQSKKINKLNVSLDKMGTLTEATVGRGGSSYEYLSMLKRVEGVVGGAGLITVNEKGEKIRNSPNIGQAKRIYSRESKSPTPTRGCTPKILSIREATKKGYTEIKDGDCFDATFPTSKTRRGRNMKDKCNCLTSANYDYMRYEHPTYRKLTPMECERLQTVPDNYTDCVSNTQRYKMLGNGWTVDVIAHIFKGLLNENL